jgi:hypothetical protein
MNMQTPSHADLTRELELTQCKLYIAQIDIRDLKAENLDLRDRIGQLIARLEHPDLPPDDGSAPGPAKAEHY